MLWYPIIWQALADSQCFLDSCFNMFMSIMLLMFRMWMLSFFPVTEFGWWQSYIISDIIHILGDVSFKMQLLWGQDWLKQSTESSPSACNNNLRRGRQPVCSPLSNDTFHRERTAWQFHYANCTLVIPHTLTLRRQLYFAKTPNPFVHHPPLYSIL